MLQKELLEFLEEPLTRLSVSTNRAKFVPGMHRQKSFSATQLRMPLANRVMDFCRAAAAWALSFVLVSFMTDMRQKNTAESLTLTWKSPFVQAVGYGWICQP